jgi:hypothetical protein
MRLERTVAARANGQSGFRTFGLMRENISFGGVPSEKRNELGQDCITRLMTSESAEKLAELFWSVAGYDAAALRLILDAASNADDGGVRNIVVLVDKAIPNLAFTNPAFAKDVLRQFTGERRQLIVDALAYQASHFGNGVFVGLPGEHMEDQQRQFRDKAAAFPDEPGFEDLTRALRRLT